jgi:hypothetical protein
MTSYFEQLVDFVGAHPQLSFLAVFLLALSEAVVGTVVPGSNPCNQCARDGGRYPHEAQLKPFLRSTKPYSGRGV